MALDSAALWASYLTAALRSFARHRAYAFINVAGLSLGLAAFLIILIHVRYELSYDSWLPEADRAFQLQQWVTGSDDPNVTPGGLQMTSYVSGRRLRQFAQLDRVVYVGNGQPVILQNGEATVSEDFVWVDGPLFDILQIPFLHGDRSTALAAPGSIVLTESEAVRRFGTADAVGRTLTLVAGGQTTDYRITGVIRDPPRNSHLALVDRRARRCRGAVRRPAARSSPSGCRRTAGSMRASGPAPTQARSPGRCRPGSGATSPIRCSAASAPTPAPMSTGACSMSATSISARRRGRACGPATTARRSPRWRWSAS